MIFRRNYNLKLCLKFCKKYFIEIVKNVKKMTKITSFRDFEHGKFPKNQEKSI